MTTAKITKPARKTGSGKEKVIKETGVTPVSLDSKKVFVVKHPLITEKSYKLSAEGKYVFMVDNQTNKSEVKKAVKILYKVDPISVNIINSRRKNKHFGPRITAGSKYKKAIVTLKKGQKIDVMPT